MRRFRHWIYRKPGIIRPSVDYVGLFTREGFASTASCLNGSAVSCGDPVAVTRLDPCGRPVGPLSGSSSLPGSLTLAEVMNAPQTAAQPVCGGDPFDVTPCPVDGCTFECDRYVIEFWCQNPGCCAPKAGEGPC